MASRGYDWQLARLLWDQGVPKRVIAERVGCSMSRLWSVSKDQHWPHRPTEISKDRMVAAQYKSGEDWHAWSMQKLYPGRGYLALSFTERDIVCAVARFMAGIPQRGAENSRERRKAA